MKKMLLLSAIATAPLPAAAQPSHIELQSLSYAGSACPYGSLAGSLNAAGIKILSEGIVVESGPGIPFNQKRKHCQLNINLSFTPGWSYAVSGFQSSLYLALDRGQSFMLGVTTYFYGLATRGLISRLVVQGPLDRDVRHSDAVSPASLVWSPCGANRALNVKIETRIESRGAARGLALIPNQNIESDTFTLPLVWRRC